MGNTRELKQRLRRRQREQQKKQWVNQQNNNSARASRSFLHFLAVVARLQRESSQFHVLSRRGTQDKKLSFSFPEL